MYEIFLINGLGCHIYSEADWPIGHSGVPEGLWAAEKNAKVAAADRRALFTRFKAKSIRDIHDLRWNILRMEQSK